MASWLLIEATLGCGCAPRLDTQGAHFSAQHGCEVLRQQGLQNKGPLTTEMQTCCLGLVHPNTPPGHSQQALVHVLDLHHTA